MGEAKEADWIRCGKQLQKNFFANQRSCWKKVEEKESTSRLITGIGGKDGRVLIEISEVKKQWKEYFIELLEGEWRETDTVCEERGNDEEFEEEITELEIWRAIARLKTGKLLECVAYREKC